MEADASQLRLIVLYYLPKHCPIVIPSSQESNSVSNAVVSLPHGTLSQFLLKDLSRL